VGHPETKEKWAKKNFHRGSRRQSTAAALHDWKNKTTTTVLLRVIYGREGLGRGMHTVRTRREVCTTYGTVGDSFTLCDKNLGRSQNNSRRCCAGARMGSSSRQNARGREKESAMARKALG